MQITIFKDIKETSQPFYRNVEIIIKRIREGSSNLFTLQNQFDDVQSILQIAYQDPSKVGVSGSIKKFFQEFGATTAATTSPIAVTTRGPETGGNHGKV